MDVSRARTILGVRATDDWTAVRNNYRRLIGEAHPDRPGNEGSDRAIELNAAYRELSIAKREGRLHEFRVVPPTRTPPTAPQTPGTRRQASIVDVDLGVRIVDDSTLVFDSLPNETFLRLVEAVNAIGDISYIDRSAALLEVMVRLRDNTPASLVFSLQWRAHNATCEAFATLEAIDRAERLDVGGVLEQLLDFIPPPAD